MHHLREFLSKAGYRFDFSVLGVLEFLQKGFALEASVPEKYSRDDNIKGVISIDKKEHFVIN